MPPTKISPVTTYAIFDIFKPKCLPTYKREIKAENL